MLGIENKGALIVVLGKDVYEKVLRQSSSQRAEVLHFVRGSDCERGQRETLGVQTLCPSLSRGRELSNPLQPCPPFTAQRVKSTRRGRGQERERRGGERTALHLPSAPSLLVPPLAAAPSAASNPFTSSVTLLADPRSAPPRFPSATQRPVGDRPHSASTPPLLVTVIHRHFHSHLHVSSPQHLVTCLPLLCHSFLSLSPLLSPAFCCAPSPPISSPNVRRRCQDVD